MSGMYTFMEDKNIGESSLNSARMKECLGPSVLSKMAASPVIGSAVSLATSSFAIEYARQMSTGILSSAFQACEEDGVEKGLHNYLLYSGGVQGVLRFDQASGPLIDVEVRLPSCSRRRKLGLCLLIVAVACCLLIAVPSWWGVFWQ